jgi:hypothetical protein
MRRRALVTIALGGLLSIACDGSTPPEPIRPAPPAAPAAAAPALAPVAPSTAPEPAAPVVAAPPVAAKPVDSCGLTAKISTGRGPEGSTKYTLTLKNGGDKPLTLVTPGDGSEYGRRTPKLSWSGTIAGKPAQEVERPGCGMMNVIEASEVFTLAPGESKAMTDWIHGPSFAPGRYEVKLRYVNDPTDTDAAQSKPEVVDLIAKSSACDVTSEPLTIKLP